MINLLVTLDSNYVHALCSLLCSITISNPKEAFNLYVAHSSLTKEDFEKIEYSVSDYDFEIYPIKLDDSLFKNAPVKKRITKETYYRIFAPKYLPDSVDRILYIDPDTVVINSLYDFYNSDFGGNLIIGAKHFDGFIGKWNKARLFLKKSPHYINAGVMLMDIENMRKSFSEDTLYRIIKRKIPVLFLADQDAINILYDGKIATESEFLINLDERTFKKLPNEMEGSLSYVRQNTVIVHFNGKYKPWNSGYKGALDCFWQEFGFAPKFKMNDAYDSKMDKRYSYEGA